MAEVASVPDVAGGRRLRSETATEPRLSNEFWPSMNHPRPTQRPK